MSRLRRTIGFRRRSPKAVDEVAKSRSTNIRRYMEIIELISAYIDDRHDVTALESLVYS